MPHNASVPTRRTFLHTMTSAAAAVALPRWSGVAGSESRAPADRIERIGLQLYTVRSEMQKDVAGTLGRVAAIGYREVEFAGYLGEAPGRIRDLLDANHLTAPAAHYGMDAIEAGLDTTAATAKVIGHRTLIVGSLPMSLLQTLEDWKRMAGRFNAAGRRAADLGLRVGFHNHDAEFTPVDGRPLVSL